MPRARANERLILAWQLGSIVVAIGKLDALASRFGVWAWEAQLTNVSEDKKCWRDCLACASSSLTR